MLADQLASLTDTFYTFTRVNEDSGQAWYEDDLRNDFFRSADGARSAIRILLRESAGDREVSIPMQLIRVTTTPVTPESLLQLLNNNLGAFIESFEVLEIVGANERL